MHGPLGPVISVCFDSNVDSEFSDRGLSCWIDHGGACHHYRKSLAHTELAIACGEPSHSRRSLHLSNPSNNFGAFAPRVAAVGDPRAALNFRIISGQ